VQKDVKVPGVSRTDLISRLIAPNFPSSRSEEQVTAGSSQSIEALTIVPAPRTGLWIASAVVTVLVAAFLYSIATNPNFQWDVVAKYLFAPIILKGLTVTLWLTVVAMSIGLAIGIILAIMRLSSSMLLSGASAVYLWFFRGTPLLVQLIFWYNLAIVFPEVVIKIPFGPEFYRASTNDLITPYMAAILGLSLNEGAYLAEIVRAGILSVDSGQSDAARALGMRRGQLLHRIILPQAMRFIVPPTGNETIGMLKLTSLVSVIALSDLLYSAQTVYGRTFETIPLLVVACIWYLVATSTLTYVQGHIERYYNRGHAGIAAQARRL
jgi:polar amino acid transport system permease protein